MADAPEPGTAPDPGARGDDVYQPAGSDAANRPSDPLDPENTLDTEITEAPEEPGWSPPERPRAVNRHGTTADERREGEPLDDRLAAERPDPAAEAGVEGTEAEEATVDGDEAGDLPGGEGEPLDPEAGAVRAGRLARPEPPEHGGVSARDVGIDDGTAPAEEAAVHRETGIDGTAGPETDVTAGPEGEGTEGPEDRNPQDQEENPYEEEARRSP